MASNVPLFLAVPKVYAVPPTAPEKASWYAGEEPSNMRDMTHEERVMYNNALYWARVKVERERAFQQEAYRQALAEHELMYQAKPTIVKVEADYGTLRRERPAWVGNMVWWLVICTWVVILASFANSFLM